MKVLLTGGQGFLGRRVLDFLLEAGYQVRVAVRRPAPELEMLGAETLRVDLRDKTELYKAAQGVEGVVHCAGRTGICGPLNGYIEANTMTTANVLSAARRAGASWLVQTSSPSVVHNGRPMNGVDESTPYTTVERHAYSYSKMLAERLTLAADEPGFRTIALRPHVIWGPQDPHFLPRMIKRAKSGRLWLMKSHALMDATYVDNAAYAHLLAVQKLAAGADIGGRAYFISQGEPRPCIELMAEILKAASGGKLRINGFVPPWFGRAAGMLMENLWRWLPLKGEPPLTTFVVEEMILPNWFKLDRARQDLGYKPLISTEEGLRRLAEAPAAL